MQPLWLDELPLPEGPVDLPDVPRVGEHIIWADGDVEGKVERVLWSAEDGSVEVQVGP